MDSFIHNIRTIYEYFNRYIKNKVKTVFLVSSSSNLEENFINNFNFIFTVTTCFKLKCYAQELS